MNTLARGICSITLVSALSVVVGCRTTPTPAQVSAAKRAGLPVDLEVELGQGVQLLLVLIPPGSFTMGSEDRKLGPDCYPDFPVTEVTMTKPLYVGKYEVTQEQWKRVMGSNPSAWKPGSARMGRLPDRDTSGCPVDSVTWEECQEFTKRLTERNGNGLVFRLPTEAEWEYACRAGSQSLYCFGDSEEHLTKYAWFHGNSGGVPHTVGRLRPNAWGIHDMHGNRAEYCLDWLGYYSSGKKADPRGNNATSAYRALRGGGCASYPISCRASSRKRMMCVTPNSALAQKQGFAASSGRSSAVGLRIVASPVTRSSSR